MVLSHRRRAPLARVLKPTPDLAHTLQEWVTEASVLQRRGDDRAARLLQQCANEAAQVSEDFCTWLSVDESVQRSGMTPTQVRSHARKFLNTPYVRIERREYFLLACIVPRRVALEMMDAATARRTG